MDLRDAYQNVTPVGDTPPPVVPPVVTPPVDEPGVITPPPADTPPPPGDNPPPVEKTAWESVSGQYESLFNEMGIDSEESMIKALKGVELNEKLTSTEKERNELVAKMSKAKDPMSYFNSEDEYLQSCLVRKREELGLSDESIPHLKKLGSPAEIAKMSPESAITMELLISNPSLTEEGIRSFIMDEYGIDDMEDLSETQKTKLILEGKDARDKLTGLYQDIKIPEKYDYETERSNTITEAEEKVGADLKEFNSIEVEGVSIDIDEATKIAIQAEIRELVIASNNIKGVTQETILAAAKEKAIAANISSIIEKVRAVESEKYKEEIRKANEGTPLGEVVPPNPDAPRISTGQAVYDKLING